MKRSAFTLVELLAGLLLTSLLLVAVANLLGIVGRRTQVLLDKLPDQTWQDVAMTKLRWDMDNAKSWELSPKRLKLSGFLWSDRVRRRPTQTSAVVVYDIRTVAGKTWLTRTCHEVNSLNNAPPTKELICGGLDRFQVLMQGMSQPVENISGSVPKCFQLSLLGAAQATSITAQFVRQ